MFGQQTYCKETSEKLMWMC